MRALTSAFVPLWIWRLSLGDFVLTGGEGAALVISDAVIRLLDHVIKEESHSDDSFENGLLEYPQFTRPIEYEGMRVPDVLLSVIMPISVNGG